jgi:hypothetical protein
MSGRVLVGSRPTGAGGSRRCWPPAMTCTRSIRCRWPRYRERHSTSGAKSDARDAHALGEIVRLDRAQHRQFAGGSPEVEGLKLVARAHQSLVWDRQRQVLRLRSALREYFPAVLEAFAAAGLDLADPDALEVLGGLRTRTALRSCPDRRSPPRWGGPTGGTGRERPNGSSRSCVLRACAIRARCRRRTRRSSPPRSD